ncbi:hypothetical protein [Chamaesiphon sp.]|uniref:hypothetical protein n=1 Tax=Chamaesiphon sp. TaxID=2814140 RepID=UPI0035936951
MLLEIQKFYLGSSYSWVCMTDLIGKIATGQENFKVVRQLKKHSKYPYEFINVENNLAHCAQTLSYPEFHAAWHQTHLPTNP